VGGGCNNETDVKRSAKRIKIIYGKKYMQDKLLAEIVIIRTSITKSSPCCIRVFVQHLTCSCFC
jgi:hypothetical protein